MFPDKTIREIFMNTHELHNLHEVLRNKLKDRIENWYVCLFCIFLIYSAFYCDHWLRVCLMITNQNKISMHFWIRMCNSTLDTRVRSSVRIITVGVSNF